MVGKFKGMKRNVGVSTRGAQFAGAALVVAAAVAEIFLRFATRYSWWPPGGKRKTPPPACSMTTQTAPRRLAITACLANHSGQRRPQEPSLRRCCTHTNANYPNRLHSPATPVSTKSAGESDGMTVIAGRAPPVPASGVISNGAEVPARKRRVLVNSPPLPFCPPTAAGKNPEPNRGMLMRPSPRFERGHSGPDHALPGGGMAQVAVPADRSRCIQCRRLRRALIPRAAPSGMPKQHKRAGIAEMPR